MAYLDGARTNVNDQMMLVRQRNRDRVMSWREFYGFLGGSKGHGKQRRRMKDGALRYDPPGTSKSVSNLEKVCADLKASSSFQLRCFVCRQTG